MLLTYFCKETDDFYQKIERKKIGDGEYYYLFMGRHRPCIR